MKPDIVFVDIGDDWAALYINGRLAHENHTISANDVLRALGLKYTRVSPVEDVDTAPKKLPPSWRKL